MSKEYETGFICEISKEDSSDDESLQYLYSLVKQLVDSEFAEKTESTEQVSFHHLGIPEKMKNEREESTSFEKFVQEIDEMVQYDTIGKYGTLKVRQSARKRRMLSRQMSARTVRNE